jgi:hypothetical protein
MKFFHPHNEKSKIEMVLGFGLSALSLKEF